jgi:predicted DNA-binding protein (MmcQ/YjbR family)
MPRHPAERLRDLCLALPDATEAQMRRGPTYRIANKIFAMERPQDEAVAVWCKAPPGSQAVLVGADPERFFVPPYVGPKGWIGIRLDGKVDWSEVATLIERSYRLIAPKRRASSRK